MGPERAPAATLGMVCAHPQLPETRRKCPIPGAASLGRGGEGKSLRGLCPWHRSSPCPAAARGFHCWERQKWSQGRAEGPVWAGTPLSPFQTQTGAHGERKGEDWQILLMKRMLSVPIPAEPAPLLPPEPGTC